MRTIHAFLRQQLFGALFTAALILPNTSYANNLSITNVRLGAQDAANNTYAITFDMSWENSWRVSSSPANWDAAWVFFKFRVGITDPVLTGASSSGTTVTVSSTSGLRAGMPVSVTSGTGSFSSGTAITAILSSTTFQVSSTPSVALSGATVTATRIWEHAWLKDTGWSGGSGGSAATMTFGRPDQSSAYNATTNPNVGAFVYRAADGSGTFSNTGYSIHWSYGDHGLTDSDQLDIRGFALEMVYVPEGSFFVGSGSSVVVGGSLTDGSWTSGDAIPYQITSENAITIGQVAGQLWGTSSSGRTTIGGAGTLPAAFNKGYAAFYCMKYEVTQQQWIDFFNGLTNLQKTNLDLTNNSNGHKNMDAIRLGNNISWTSGDATLNSGIYGPVALNYIAFRDGAAFLDWAGLRYMTELEFEKACRGTNAVVTSEHAWGTASVTALAAVTNEGLSNEASATSGANVTAGNLLNRPTRVGMYAGSSTTRVQSGASFYGIMELSGNVFEPTVTVGNTNGRAYTGLHGNGTITRSGYADVTNWPGLVSGEVTGFLGYGNRGGSNATNSNLTKVSDRNFAVETTGNANYSTGVRGVRTAP